MRRWLPLALFLLLLPATARGQTYPRDDTGAVAAPCVWQTGATGAFNLCGDNNPLPFSTAPSSAADPVGWGRTAFSSTFSGGNANTVTGLWADDQTAIAINVATVAYNLYRATRGVAFVAQGTITTNIQPQQPLSMLQLPSGDYLVAGAVAGGNSMFRGNLQTMTSIAGTAPAGVTFTFSLVLQGSTVLAAGEHATLPVICRSSNQGSSFTCTTSPTGLTGVFGTTNGRQRVASPALNTWLALNDVGTVFRSTDDGVTWASVATLAPTTTQPRSLVCGIASNVCLASAQSNLYRSTDGGQTWTQTFTQAAAPPGSVRGFLNYGNNVIVAWIGATAQPALRSADGGISWPSIISGPGVAVTTVTSNLETRNGRGILFSTGTQQAIYTPAIGAGETSIVGGNGQRLAVNADGSLTATQGAAGTAPWLTSAAQGAGAVNSGTLEAWQTTPVQRGTLVNSETTGAANTAVVTTIAAVANARAHLYRVDARCSAGTAQLTVQDGGTTIWSTVAGAVTTAQFASAWAPGLTGTTNTAMTITLSTCGVGNTGTLTAQADRF